MLRSLRPWQAAALLWVALGYHVEAFAFQAADGAESGALTRTGAEYLQRSPSLRDYLLTHIGVSQGDQACSGTIASVADPVADGAAVVFDCPQAIETVEVSISMLTDMHDAYRTVASSDTPASPGQLLFTEAATSHAWTFGAEQRVPEWPVTAAGGMALTAGVAAGATALWRRRRRALAP